MSDTVLRDLGRKCADDVSQRIRQSAGLFNNPQDMFFVALSGLASAGGLAVGFAEKCGAYASPEETVDTILSLVRPMLLTTAGGSDADFRALLAAAPKARKP